MAEKLRHKIKINVLFTIGSLVVYAMVAISSVIVINHKMKEEALNNARSKALIILERNTATHEYFMKNLRPALLLMCKANKDKSFKNSSFMSSSYAINQIHKNHMKNSNDNYYYKSAVMNARNPQNEADKNEKKILTFFMSNPKVKDITKIQTINNKTYFSIYKPGEIITKQCSLCHTKSSRAPRDLVKKYGSIKGFNHPQNELINIISIRIPLDEAYSRANKFSNFMILFYFISLFIILSLIYFSSYVIFFNPLKRIHRETQKALNSDNTFAEIPTPPIGIELYDLTTDFNNMMNVINNRESHLEEDVNERTKELNNSLKEKNILLKEVHHRVKNNMQVISSLLNLQITQMKDERDIDLLRHSQHRIMSMAMVHEKLYHSETLFKVNFREYIDELTQELILSYMSSGKQVELHLDIEDIDLEIDTLIPCGLIINEAVSNSLKYAFDNKNSGQVTITFGTSIDAAYLVIEDNGPGLNNEFNEAKKDSLGLQLIESLTIQLGGKLKVTDNDGFLISLSFPLKKKSNNSKTKNS